MQEVQIRGIVFDDDIFITYSGKAMESKQNINNDLTVSILFALI